MEKLDEIGAKR